MKNSFIQLSAIVLYVATVSGVLGQAGSLDITFNPGTGASGNSVRSIFLETDGHVMIGGLFSAVNGVPRNQIARLNADGSLDAGFYVGQGPDNTVRAIAVLTNGMVLIGGDFTSVSSLARLYLARLRSDGSLDLAFNPFANDSVETMVLQPDGKILIAGAFTVINGTPRNRVARLNSDGSLDAGFDPGTGANNVIHALSLQTNGMVLVGGSFTTMNASNRSYIARLNADGSLDTSFDCGFVGGSGVSPITVSAVAVRTSGKVIVGGTFVSINGYSRFGMAQLASDGSVDTAFVSPSFASPSSSLNSISIQSDEKVIVGGGFHTFLGNPAEGIARLKPDGTVDPSFSASVNLAVFALAAQPDGKVLIGGDFFTVNGTNISKIARLNGGSPPAGLQFLSPNRYFGSFLAGTTNNTYRVEWTTNLNAPSLWTPLFNVTLQENPQFILDPTPISGRQRYYRAVSLP